MEKVVEEHFAEFDSNPEVIASAPARFHLLGEHSWYFRDKTISMAVDKPVYVAISFRNDAILRFYFPQLKERKRGTFTALKFRREDRWANSIKSVIQTFVSFGNECKGMNFTVYSDILPSSGFGINTAIMAASAIALCKLYNVSSTSANILKIMNNSNGFFPDVGNFSADVNTVLFAKKNSVVVTDYQTGKYETVPFKFKDMSILLTDSHVPRISVWSEETIRKEENLRILNSLKIKKGDSFVYETSNSEIAEVMGDINEDLRRKLLCIMKEYQFTTDAIQALRDGNFGQFAKSVNHSHEMLRDQYLISCPEIDWLIKRVTEFDVSSTRNASACARITGKGLGRCAYSILRTSDVENYAQKLVEYERIFGFHAEFYEVKSVAGACVAK